MKKEPLVSIVIPVYNREELINKALETSCAQTYSNIEIIVVDNKSTDQTWQVLEEWSKKDKRIRIFQNTENLGPVRNWKRCLDEARGEFCKILWSDDWMDYTFIETAIHRMTVDTAFVLSWCDVVKSNGEKLFGYHFDELTYNSQYYIRDILFYKEKNFPVSPGCALFRLQDLREALIEKVPNLDNLDSSKNGAGNDLLLYLTTAFKYKSIDIIPEVLNFFRYHESSISVSTDIGKYYEWSKCYFINIHPKYKYWAFYVVSNNRMRKYLQFKPSFGFIDKLKISYIEYYVFTKSKDNVIIKRKLENNLKVDIFVLYKAVCLKVRKLIGKL